jgi:hypothetical protein
VWSLTQHRLSLGARSAVSVGGVAFKTVGAVHLKSAHVCTKIGSSTTTASSTSSSSRSAVQNKASHTPSLHRIAGVLNIDFALRAQYSSGALSHMPGLRFKARHVQPA